jgi:hypothetical protein
MAQQISRAIDSIGNTMQHWKWKCSCMRAGLSSSPRTAPVLSRRLGSPFVTQRPTRIGSGECWHIRGDLAVAIFGEKPCPLRACRVGRLITICNNEMAKCALSRPSSAPQTMRPIRSIPMMMVMVMMIQGGAEGWSWTQMSPADDVNQCSCSPNSPRSSTGGLIRAVMGCMRCRCHYGVISAGPKSIEAGFRLVMLTSPGWQIVSKKI